MIIKNNTLARIVELRQAKKSIAEELEQLEDGVLASLQIGTKVEAGEYTAAIDTLERRNVKWRAVVERLKSVGYADKVLAATKPDVYQKLVVAVAQEAKATVSLDSASSVVVAKRGREVA